MKNLRIAYMGTPSFAVGPLKALRDAGANIVAVVTTPDRPAGRGLKLRESDVKKFALENNLPVYQPEKMKDPQWIETYRSLEIDLAVVVAFRMLPEIIWAMPPKGTFNLHASLLPNYRGAAPINWAIINGDTKTGVTTFFIDSKIDCGEIIDSAEIEIAADDTVGVLHDKLCELGSDLVVATVERIANGTVVPKPQVEVQDELRAQAPKIFKDDCRIDWTLPAKQTYDMIRGLSPYPAAWCEFGKLTAKLYEAHYSIENHDKPSGVFENIDNKQIRVSLCDGYLYIDKLQVAGAKKPLSAQEFLRGNTIDF